ncbi:MAG: hypothetical protein AAF570_28920, partial [Bacteroidota bacterium]
VENAIWHGIQHLPEGAIGELSITFSREADQTIVCTIRDNGVGRRAAGEIARHNQDRHSGKATAIIQKRLDLLRKIYRSPDFACEIRDHKTADGQPNGTEVRMRFPFLIAPQTPSQAYDIAPSPHDRG